MLAVILHLKYLENHRLLKFIVSLICSFLFVFNATLFHRNLCPDCYGDDLCYLVDSRQFKLTFLSYIFTIFHPALTKSVFYGIINESEYIVLKRKSDRNVETRVSVQNKLSNQINFYLRPSVYPRNLIFCPGFRNITWFFDYLEESVNKRHLWLDFENSIEPILLRYFQSLGEKPFPKYLGACGNIIGEEYKGLPLMNYVSSDFKQRIILGAKILEIARIATFESPDFIFYFTDISLYNLVVDFYGNVSLIDLDNVILLDRKNYLDSVSRKIHKSELFNDSEYAFSPTDICNHYISDHNYFSVCKQLLTDPKNGLFSDILQNKSKAHIELINLLNECENPKTSRNRLKPGKKLESFLQNMIKNHNF